MFYLGCFTDLCVLMFVIKMDETADDFCLNRYNFQPIREKFTFSARYILLLSNERAPAKEARVLCLQTPQSERPREKFKPGELQNQFYLFSCLFFLEVTI